MSLSRPIFATCWLSACLLAAVSLGAASLPRDSGNPVGLWKTIDDHSGKPRGFVRIYERNGEFFGRVESSLNPKDAKERCDLCTDDRKDQPVIGMELIRHLKRAGAEEFNSGEILDPDSGVVYRCKMKLLDQGQKLNIRGYVGVALLGRTQTWYRQF